MSNEAATAEQTEDIQSYVNEQGEFKSLGHMLNYTGSMPELPEGAPNPEGYRPDQEDKFREDLNLYRQEKAISKGISEALKQAAPQEPGLTPWGDDPYRKQRQEFQAWHDKCQRMAQRAKDNGQPQEADAWVKRSHYFDSDMEKLPPPPVVQYHQEQDAKISKGAVDILFDPNNEKHPFWNEDRIQSDAAAELHRHNQRGSNIRLPLENTPFGNIQNIRPSNMIQFDLPENQVESFRQHVYGSGESDPDKLFRRSWSWLHKFGYAQSGKLAIEPKAPKKTEEKKKITRHPDDMSYSEFEQWRLSQGAKRR